MMGKLTKLILIAFTAAGLMVFGVVAAAAHAQQIPLGDNGSTSCMSICSNP
jgi:Spy/CpxP family protein refolding chaperone